MQATPKSNSLNKGLLLGPMMAAAIWFLPLGNSLTPEAHRLAAITVLMAIWWMTEALPVAVTALLPLALFPVFGIGTAKEVAPNYGHDLIWLFFGGFQLAFAVERWNLHRRLAMFMVRTCGTRADRLILGFMLASGLLSMWLLNTSTTLMLLPVAIAVASAMESKEFEKALMLGVAYAASVGGMGTYLGTAPNGVFREVAAKNGTDLSFGEWMSFAAPLSILLILVIWYYLTRLAFRIQRTPIPVNHPAQSALTGPKQSWSQGERRVAVIFIAAVTLWISRKYILLKLGLDPKGITDATVAIGITILLYIVPTRTSAGHREALLSWSETAKTPWQILILFGGGFALASGFKATGLSQWLGSLLAASTSGWPLPLMVLAVVLFMTFLTEVTSNTATSIILLPIICELAVATDVGPLMLLLPATLAASCAFMLPVATPPNAVVYGSGMIRLPDMARVGFGVNIISALLITLWTLTWGAFLF
ncbi:MAG: SLC13 family permease [Myxococcota bacterium]|nr:SLC13 family permease [Myxococcota bacterium]